MALQTHLPDTDLIGVQPGAGPWEPSTVHTHYFGFQVPEAAIGGFLYIRYQPFFPLSQGSVVIFEGRDNLTYLDAAFLDWQMAMPYPQVTGQVITTANGFRIDFLELGRSARTTYTSSDGTTSFDLVHTAVTPLVARSAVIPGENVHESDGPGGTEQFMHCVGEVTLRGRNYSVDCYMPRDRSWRQSRTEQRGGRHDPPIAWTPIFFPATRLAFNQVGFESPETEPVWAGALAIPPGAPEYHFAWIWADGELREVTDVRRSVDELHPQLPAPLRQTIEARDDSGARYRFTGEAVALAAIPSWPNAGTYDSVVRWTDADGNLGYGPCQGIWYDGFARLMKMKRLTGAR
jgi:hypothetical protein